MQRQSRLKGGHRVGINPNSTSGLSYQPIASQNPQLSADQNWNYQQTSWSQPNAYHRYRSDSSPNAHLQDSSWDWGSSSGENFYSSSNQPSGQGVSSYNNNNNIIKSSSHAPQDVASPQFTVDSRTSPHVTQNRALSHVAQESSSLHGTYPNTSSNNQAIHSTSECANNLASSVNSQNTISQNQSSDEWGWNNDDNWENWGNGEGIPSVAANCSTFKNNNALTTSISQNSTVMSGDNEQETLQHNQPTFHVAGYCDNNFAQSGHGRIEDSNVVVVQNQNMYYHQPLQEGYSQNQFIETEKSNMYSEPFQQPYDSHTEVVKPFSYSTGEADVKLIANYEHESETLHDKDGEGKEFDKEITSSQNHVSYSSDMASGHSQQYTGKDIVSHTSNFNDGSFTNNPTFDHQSTKDDWKWNEEDLNAMNKVNEDLSDMVGQLSLEPSSDQEANLKEKSELQNNSVNNTINFFKSEPFETYVSHHLDSQIITEPMPQYTESYENNYNVDYNSAYQHESQKSVYHDDRENENQVHSHSLDITQDSTLFMNPDVQNNLFHDKTAEKSLTQLQSSVAAAPSVAEWDDEWNDGWDRPHSIDTEVAENCQKIENNDHLRNRIKENPDELPKVISMTEGDKAASSVSNMPEVKNIHALNQGLHGIFRSPSDNMLLKNSCVPTDEIHENKSNFPQNNSHLTLQESAFSNIPTIYYQDGHHEEANKGEMEDIGQTVKTSEPELENLQQLTENLPPSNLTSDNNCDSQRYIAKDSKNAVEMNDACDLSHRDSRPGSNQSSSHSSQPPSYPLVVEHNEQELFSLTNSLSRPQYFPNQPSIEPPMINELVSGNQSICDLSLVSSSVTLPTAPEETSAFTEHFQPTETPPLMRPVGNISQLHARKGSPFQPPASKKSCSPQAQSNTIVDTSTFFANQDLTTSSNSVVENSLIANSHPPEQTVKLSVASNEAEPKCQDLAAQHEIVPNAIPVFISSNNSFPASEETNIENVSAADDTTNHSSYNSFPLQQRVPPPAHLSSLPPNICQPKVKKLDAMVNISSSPGVLDLTQSFGRPDKTASERDVPSFSRMVPGESKKGESNGIISYHAPIVVPEMPSERVVTGNAYPQPVPISRIKQEPNEIRSPPDGPDTADSRKDLNTSVIPPIRSETIGSEDMVVRQHPNDRRDERISDHRRDRNSWDRDAYEERHSHERKREGRDRYRDESPYSRRRYDRDYDSRMADGYNHRRDTDEEDEEDAERYAERRKERRNRGYRDELRMYNDKERDYRRPRRRDYEDEDPYYEGRSDRSRPSSRSSSYANLLDESGPVDFFDNARRSHKDISQREKDRDFRDRDGKNKDRSMREAEPSYRDSRLKGPRDPYMTGGYPYPEHFGQRGMYDPQSYYYYYQNYYKDYYRRLYGSSGYTYAPGGESMVDDKASTRSGRSSVNDEMKKSSVSSMAPYDPYGGVFDDQHRPYMPSSQFRQDFLHQSSNLGAFEPSAIYPEHGPFSQMHPYASGDVSGVPSITDEVGSDVQQRLSPHLFSGPHLSASFTSGGKLLLVIPSDPKQGEKARVQIRNVQKMMSIDKDLAARIQKMKNYPGPLTVNDTHKDVVISFCNQKVAEALNNKTIMDQDSVVLFWEYLALLVKQNGKVCGADLASLLLKGREVTISGDADSPQHERSSDVDVVTSNLSPTEGINITETNNEAKQLEYVKKFSELLCLGRKREAVDYAIKEGLWGYAMTLAAKMDTATHTRVMSAFTQSIPKTHVLQTLLQHLSGKKPDVSKTYNKERWGDWRLHLAMMVSNPTGQLLRDRASIFAFGDTLAAKNLLHAAHLCYLAADAEWGTFSNKESKLVLLGANNHLPFHIFANDNAIQCTEIYEYAMALDSANHMMTNFQCYKLIYALRLAEAGFPSEALKYCEVINEAIIRNVGAYQIGFVSQVLDLATQLKYYDVHYQMGEGEAREMPDPEWLLQLQNALYTLQYLAAQQQELAAATQEQVVKEEQHAYECTTIKQEPTYPTYNAETPSLTNNNASVTNNMSLGFDSSECVNHSEPNYPEKSHYDDGNNAQESSSEVPMVPTLDDPYKENLQSSMPFDESYRRDGESDQIPMINNSAPPSMAYYGNTENSQSGWNQQQQQWQTNQQQQQWQTNQQQSWQQENTLHYTTQNGNDMIDSGSSNIVSHNSVRDAEEEQYWSMMSQKGDMDKDVAVGKMLKDASKRNSNSRRVTFDPSHTVQYTYSNKKALCQKQENFDKKIVPSFSRCGNVMLHKGTRNIYQSYFDKPLGCNDYETGIARSNLIFGGSFPIDTPISARQLGTDPSTRSLKTYQVDAVCCSVPNLCPEHSTGKRKINCGKYHKVSRHPVTQMHNHEKEPPYILTFPVDENLEQEFCSEEYYEDDCPESNCEEDDEYDEYPYIEEEELDEADIDYEAGYNRVEEKSLPIITKYSVTCPTNHTCLHNPSLCSKKASCPPTSLPINSPPVMSQTICESKNCASHLSIDSNTDICPQPSVGSASPNEKKNSTQGQDVPSMKPSVATDNLPKAKVQGGTSNSIAPPAEPKEPKHSEDELAKKKEELPKAAGSEDKMDDKKSSGLLGSLFGWGKAKKNQAKLPDDKNPSIVWDEQKKKWVNVDGDEADEVAPPPPPSNLPGPANLTSFRGGLKNPVGEKSRTKPAASPLLPPIPNNSPLQTGPVRQMEPTNFMPLPSDNQSPPNLGPRNEIQMRRNRYVSESSSVDLSKEWDPGLSQEASNDSMGGPIPMMGPPDSQQPLFFNPSQMKSAPASHQVKRAGPSRRVFHAP